MCCCVVYLQGNPLEMLSNGVSFDTKSCCCSSSSGGKKACGIDINCLRYTCLVVI